MWPILVGGAVLALIYQYRKDKKYEKKTEPIRTELGNMIGSIREMRSEFSSKGEEFKSYVEKCDKLIERIETEYWDIIDGPALFGEVKIAYDKLVNKYNSL